MKENFWQIIANPTAGGGRVGRQGAQIKAQLAEAGISIDWRESTGPMHAVELVQDRIRKGARQIAVLGGDGTVNEVVNGIMTQKGVPSHAIKLAVLPAGTGGDFARMYGIKSLRQGIRLLEAHQTIRQDAGLAHWQTKTGSEMRYFCNVAGMAFDAFVTATTADMNKAGWRGTMTYLWAVLRNLWRYKQEQLTLEMAGAQWREVAILANAGICRHNGGGMNLVPLADPFDGLFDVSLVEQLRPQQVLAQIAKLYNGNLYAHPKAHHLRGAWLEILTPTGLEVDGEYLGLGTGRLEIIPQALAVSIPPNWSLTH